MTLIDTGILPGYRWHRLARIWRTPVLGELFQAISTPARAAAHAARGRSRAGCRREFLDRVHYTSRTRRAVLELYRATDDPGAAATEFAAFMASKDIPALVIWGEHDAYLPSSYAERQRERVPVGRRARPVGERALAVRGRAGDGRAAAGGVRRVGWRRRGAA